MIYLINEESIKTTYYEIKIKEYDDINKTISFSCTMNLNDENKKIIDKKYLFTEDYEYIKISLNDRDYKMFKSKISSS